MGCEAQYPKGGPKFNEFKAQALQKHTVCITQASDEYGECLLDAEAQTNKDQGKQRKEQFAKGVEEGLKAAQKQADALRKQADNTIEDLEADLALLGAGTVTFTSLGFAAEKAGNLILANTLKGAGASYAVAVAWVWC